MAVLKFTLNEEGVNVLREALTCLGKFSDEVALEAKKDRVCVDTSDLILMLPTTVIMHCLLRRISSLRS